MKFSDTTVLHGCAKVVGKFVNRQIKKAERKHNYFRNFIVHQRKGGIHAIYRSIMDAFGYYRVTGLSPKIVCRQKMPGPPVQLVAFLLKRSESMKRYYSFCVD